MGGENKFGIDETAELLDAAVSTFNVVKEVTAEDSPGGKSVSFIEYPQFLSPVTKVFKGISGVKEIPDELGDTITEEEEDQLYQVLVKAEINVPVEKKQEFIREHLDWLRQGQALLTKWYL